MNKLLTLFVALAVIAGLGLPAMAQPMAVGAQKTINAKIRALGVFGEGIATSKADPMDFELIKMAIAKLKVIAFGEEVTVRVGVLHFGDEKYKLKNVVIENTSSSGDIYKNGTKVGTFSVDSYIKGNREVWAGSMTLNDKEYNIYVIQVPRKVKTPEIAERVFEYCKNNPEKCKAAVKAVGKQLCENEKNCADKIKSFCSQHPEDARCKALHRAYCATHLSDSTCREELIKYCKENPERPVCMKLSGVYEKSFEKRPEMVKRAPEWFKKLRERMKISGANPKAGEEVGERLRNKFMKGEAEEEATESEENTTENSTSGG